MSGITAWARTTLTQPWSLGALAVVFLTLTMIAAQPAGAGSGSLLVSPNANRSGASALDGNTVSGTAYVYLSTGEAVQRVTFSLDGADVNIENQAPYDFAGTAGSVANPWSTGSVGDGAHSITATVALVGGGEFTVSGSFTVNNTTPAATPAPGATGSLLVSSAANRSGASALDGATLSGSRYVFLQSSGDIARVDFSLDGAPHWTENYAPFDFAGGESAAANAWATGSVATGSHTISALVVLKNGSQSTVSASFTVASGPSGTATPTASATPASTATGELRVSQSANRANSSALGAQSLVGDAYVFVTSSASLSEVRFYLDGTFVRTEKATPYDFGGTTASGTAGRWNTTGATEGTHEVKAVVTTSAGASFTLIGSVLVDNNPAESGSSEVQTTSTGGAASIDVFISGSANRSGAEAFGAATVSGNAYVYAVPSKTPQRIRFYIDPDLQPLPIRSEQASPYDLGGTLSDGGAGPFNMSGLSDGVHTLQTVAEFADGTTVSKLIDFTVKQPVVLPTVAYALQVSTSANRSGGTPLNASQLTGDSYVFVGPVDYLAKATFYLDDVARTSADRVDTAAPFDLIGGTASAALPLSISGLTSGSHTLTVVLERTNGTTVELQATFSVGGTLLPNGAVLIKTSDNAAQIAGQHGAGTTFVFDTGVHRGASVSPQSGDVFMGLPGAILNGSVVLSGWSATSGFWSVGGQTSELTGTGGCAVIDGSLYDACKYPEQLFVDGVAWWQVTSIGKLGQGKWFFDYGANRVYIGGNPSGRLVELSTTPTAFSGSASDVTITGLTIEKYANRAQTGAIEAGSGNRWVISGNETRLNHGYGIRVGNRAQALNNFVHHNGQLGMGGVGDDILIEGNEISYNHTGGFLLDWEAGGTKFAKTNRLVVRNNWVHHNEGRGLWTDIDNINVLMVGNLVEYNAKGGIVHEIGYKAEFRDNVSRYNGHGFGEWEWGAQIVIQNSSDVLVTGNDVTVSATTTGNGITVINQERGSGPYGPYVSERVTVTGNTIRHLGVRGVNGANQGCSRDITFDYNTYIAPAGWFQYAMFHWCSAENWAGFQSKGQEAHGTKIVS